jgi:hypothetical protein
MGRDLPVLRHGTQELFQVLARDEPPSAYLQVAQIPASHLVI